VLELLPSPLPGWCAPEELQQLLVWAVQLTLSPRVRESDAGARLLRLLYVKYILELGWQLQVHPVPQAMRPQLAAAPDAQEGQQQQVLQGTAGAKSTAGKLAGGLATDLPVVSVVAFLSSLTGQLRMQVAAAKVDMAAASRCGLFHGTLLALRYVVEATPWPRLTSFNKDTVSVAVSSTTAAGIVAAAQSHQQQQEQKQHHGSQQGCTDSVSSPPAVSEGGGCDGAARGAPDGVVAVSGLAGAVLQYWCDDLLGLLKEAAGLVQPVLCAQVTRRRQLACCLSKVFN
jgi:hypothetical protein